MKFEITEVENGYLMEVYDKEQNITRAFVYEYLSGLNVALLELIEKTYKSKENYYVQGDLGLESKSI